MVSVEELDELSSIVQVPLCAGTVNRGSNVLGAGLIVNDFTSFCGIDTTSNEISVIENIFRLNERNIEGTGQMNNPGLGMPTQA
jgi:translation initiation factor 6|mmetsp:Transcript_23262/g.3820  ORF Transcript_23262/g.3820 Transcript_23262/m.3820 type:complete len:84 (+) Transcript_23262:488-739(+)